MSAFKILLLSLLFLTVNLAYAGVAPIKNMPEYNGTYWGSPGTGGNCDSNSINCDSIAGRSMFSTLYRDNYDNRSTCAGENCGSHAGVDILVVSGTPVVASLAGKIVESGCKDYKGSGLTGGTIIIEANNPYISGNKVYLVYAHLDDWDLLAEGDIVTQGQVIGYSGGVKKNPDGTGGGVCPGASGGAHLHFQVDKNPPDANGRPWIPGFHSSVPTDTADADFIVSKYTYNPLPFVTGKAYNFNFSEAKNSELWGVANANSTGVASGSLWIDGEGPTVYTGRSSMFPNATCGSGKCSREITLNADIFKKVMFDLDFKCPAGKTTLHYRGTDNVWRSGFFGYSSAVGSKYNLDLSGQPYWKGIITDFLIQPSPGCMANTGTKEYFIKQMYFYR
ncbi:MAG: hemolysin-type calcium binding protein [Candidatus Parcubacteria bacterium]|jgi:hypothetical protein